MYGSLKNKSDKSQPVSSKENTPKGRILCLDIGDKRIGMAVSDLLYITAQGLPTLSRKGKKQDIKSICEIIAKWDIERILYGLPKNMDGSLGPQAEKTKCFIQKLREGIHCEFLAWDERLTTLHAHKTLKEAGLSRKKRAMKVDEISAILILQNYLDLNKRLLKNKEG